MGKAQRLKGHSWEREVAIKLREIDPDAKRLLEYQEGFGIDIETKLPLSIQCKCTAKPNFIKAFQEAKNSKKADSIPVAAIKVDHKGKFILLDFDFAFKLFQKYFS